MFGTDVISNLFTSAHSGDCVPWLAHERSFAGPKGGIACVVGIFGFACVIVMSYVCGRIGSQLIPDKSKPTATWGRKAMGQHRLPRPAVVVARLPKESRHELVHPLGVALAGRWAVRPPQQGACAPPTLHRSSCG